MAFLPFQDARFYLINTLVTFAKVSSRILCTSGLHEPQPVPAPVNEHNCLRSVQPSLILFFRLSLPTLLQLQTSLPNTGSAFFPLRSNCRRFSFSSILLAISSLNSWNSLLS